MMNEKKERKEALMRILVFIVTGIILGLWRYLIYVLVIIHWVYVLITGQRLKRMAELCEIWNSQVYDFFQYITMVTNNRPYPFSNLNKDMTKFSKKS